MNSDLHGQVMHSHKLLLQQILTINKIVYSTLVTSFLELGIADPSSQNTSQLAAARPLPHSWDLALLTHV